MLKKFYKFSYTTGTVFLILSILMTIMPAMPSLAQTGAGAIWTTTSGCGAPQNDNQYVAGNNVYVHYQNFEVGVTFNWDITGVSGPDKNVTVASGTGTISFDYANGTEGCFFAYTIQPDDDGTYKVTLDPAVGNSKTDNYIVQGTTPTATPTPTLGLTINKTANPTTVQEPGGPVTYTVRVTNTSDVTVQFDSLSDDKFNIQPECAFPATLAPGEVFQCEFTRDVTGNAGDTHTNTITANTSYNGTPISGSGSATVDIVAPPTLSLDVSKSANPTSVQEPGGAVTYTVSVTNTSNVPVQFNSLGDDSFTIQPECTIPATLAVNETYQCQFTRNVTGNAGDSHTNTVTAVISYDGLSDQGQASATVRFVAEPVLGLTVTKTPSLASVNYPGSDVTFTIEVTNTSNVDVQLTSLLDTDFNLTTDGNCSLPQTIIVGDSYSCEVTATITAQHENTVTARIEYGDLFQEDSATATVDFIPRANPTITVVKTADKTVLDEPGGSVTYTVEVTNTSGFPVTINSIVDDPFGNNPGTCATGGTINAGATYTCTYTESIEGDQSNPHVNTVTVQVIDELNKTASGSDSETVTFTPLPTISVTKTANPTTISEYGQNVTFTVVVNNTSGEALTLNSLNDSVFGDLNGKGTCGLPQDLAIGGSYQCSFTQALQGEPISQHQNTVTAIAVDSDGNQATNNDNATVTYRDVLPTITATKTAFPTSVDEPGGQVEYTFQVTNTSGEAVTLDSLVDDVFGNLAGQGDCAVGGSIAAGDTYSCSTTEQISGAAGDIHENELTATASDNDGNSVQDSDTAQVSITNVPSSLQVTKTADPIVVAEPGGDVIFTVLVENLTFEALTLTSLVDDQFGDLGGLGTCDTLPIVIAGNGSYSCEFTETINGQAGFIHINEVTAIGHGNDQLDVSDQDSAQVTVSDVVPVIQVTKTASPTSVPAPSAKITYTVEVENQSQEDVTLDSLVDDVFGNLDGLGTCAVGGIILAGDTYSCTFVKTIYGQDGDEHINVVTATVSDNENNSIEDSDDAAVIFTEAPKLVLVDPCSVDCSLPTVQGQICNEDLIDEYVGEIQWSAFVDSNKIGGGTIQSIPADSCVTLSAPRSGDGLYSISVNLVDEGRTLTTSCGPIVCKVNPRITPTPGVPPVNPPTGSSNVFIPVTGVDLGPGGWIQMFQNLGLAFLAIGLVLQSFYLKEKKQKQSVR